MRKEKEPSTKCFWNMFYHENRNLASNCILEKKVFSHQKFFSSHQRRTIFLFAKKIYSLDSDIVISNEILKNSSYQKEANRTTCIKASFFIFLSFFFAYIGGAACENPIYIITIRKRAKRGNHFYPQPLSHRKRKTKRIGKVLWMYFHLPFRFFFSYTPSTKKLDFIRQFRSKNENEKKKQ